MQPIKKRIVIIEDQTAIREMLALILGGDANYQIVGEAGDGQVACDLILEKQPDLLILDAKLPGLSGLEILRRVASKLPRMRTMVFSAHENAALIRDMLEAGAHGFVEKTAGLIEVTKGLQTVSEGGNYFGPSISRILQTVVANPTSANSAMGSLTKREREILQLIAEGLSTKEIANKLSLSAKTIDNHRTNLMGKLDLHNVASITRYAIEIGLIEAEQLP
ncbi:MAG: response regulator transcription factor [Opitutaceae bacterium]|nr:response regulator transcription factor [Opitutaceae bacterium]